VRTGFEAIRDAVERLGRGRDDRILVVSSTPGFTAKWLVPRLYRFLGRHPDIETRISASVAYANFTNDGVDVGIRLSSGVHPDLYVEKLSDEWLLPLCSPRLLNGERPLRSPHDVAHFPLIQVDLPGIVPTWADWLRLAGIEGIDTTRGLRLNVADHALDAASEGMGVVLAYKMVAARDIALKRLVRPFGPEILVPGRAYYFVCARGREKRAPIKAFRDWVFAEMEETHASLRAVLTGSDPADLTPSDGAMAIGTDPAQPSRRQRRAAIRRPAEQDRA
jgi:LysR family glycine cleavage system transcriptional activator